MRFINDKVLRILIWVFTALAIFFLAAAFYIPAKAILAQSSVISDKNWSEMRKR